MLSFSFAYVINGAKLMQLLYSSRCLSQQSSMLSFSFAYVINGAKLMQLFCLSSRPPLSTDPIIYTRVDVQCLGGAPVLVYLRRYRYSFASDKIFKKRSLVFSFTLQLFSIDSDGAKIRSL